ncbi:MAG: hypothetical protein JWN34_991, partial [Bryobacterales bacterium]|nr:hypothetical protein [Bryobacterales bacterium]
LNLPLLILRNGKNRRHSGHVSVYADLRFTSSYLLDTTLVLLSRGQCSSEKTREINQRMYRSYIRV